MFKQKQLEELQPGDVIQLSDYHMAGMRVVLFTKTKGKHKGYCYARFSEKGDTWLVETYFQKPEIRGHGHDHFVQVRGRKTFKVLHNLLGE